MRKFGFSFLGGDRSHAKQNNLETNALCPSQPAGRQGWLLAMLLSLLAASPLAAQTSSDLDLSTRSMGVPPTHTTVDSVARWMENPLDQKLTIAVTNLLADSDDYMEIKLNGQSVKFYGAGMDELGHYVPTNYPPMIVNTTLRREYPLNIMCPNSGPQGSPLFKSEDFASPDNYIFNLTNGTYAPDVSAFIWSNFTSQAKLIFTNGSTAQADIDSRQTNLVTEMNRIITTMSLYTNTHFISYTNTDPIPALAAQNPTGQALWYLNRLLLQSAIYLTANAAPDYSGSAQITFGIKAPPEIKIKNKQTAPRYTVLLNRDASTGSVLQLLANQGTGYASTTNVIIEVLKDKFGHFGLGDGCDDATKAPGQGSWLSIGPGCTQDKNRIALDWHVSLGRTFDGLAAGQLAFREPGLARSSYTPFALYYNGSMTNLYATESLLNTNLAYLSTNTDGTIATNLFVPVMSGNIWTNNGQPYTNCLVPVVLVLNNVPYLMTNSAGEVYTNYDSLIRQVKSYQTFVDILAPDTNRLVMKFYLSSQVGAHRDTNGLYTDFHGNEFVSWTLQNPDPATANKLDLIETRQGISSTQSLVKLTTSGVVNWVLTLGTGPEQRVETRQVSFAGGAIPTDRQELNTIQYGNSTPAYECQETYHSYPWGWELKETKLFSDPSNLVTTYEYYDVVNNPSDPYAGAGHGQLKQIVYPDGYWEKRIYQCLGETYADYFVDWDSYDSWSCSDGMLRYILHPYLDGREGGATTPDSASIYNTIYTRFRYSLALDQALGSGYGVRTSYLCDGVHSPIHLLRVEEDGRSDYANSEGPVDVTYTALEPGGSSESLESRSSLYSYKSSAPLGLAQHIWYQMKLNDQVQQFSYYDHGIFDSVGNQFILDSTNHLYTASGITNYPDHREVTVSELVYEPDLGESPEEMCVGQYGDSAGNIGNPHLGYFDNHCNSLEWPKSWLFEVLLKPQRGKQLTKVFHEGNVALIIKLAHTGAIIDQWTVIEKFKYWADSLGRTTNVVRIDGKSLAARTVYTADYRGNSSYDGKLLLSETDEVGAKTSYAYDSLQRLTSLTTKGYGSQHDQTTSYAYDANGQLIQKRTAVDGSSLALNESWCFDGAGRLTNQVDITGIAVQRTISSNGRITTETSPGGVTRCIETYLDRQNKSLQGSGAISEFYEYETGLVGADDWNWPNPGTIHTECRLTKTYLGHADSQRWRIKVKGGLDEDFLEIFPTGMGTTNTAWDKRQRVSSGARSGWSQYLCSSYSPKQTLSLFDGAMNETRKITSCGADSRVSGATLCFLSQNDCLFEVKTNYVCLGDGSDSQTVTSISLKQLNGFSGNVISRTTDYDADTNVTVTTTSLNQVNNMLTVVTSQPQTSSLAATNVYQNGLLISSSTLSVATPTQYKYDALGRTNEIITPLGYHAYITYDLATGWVTSQTDFTGQTTAYEYYGVTETNAGKLKCQTSATGKKTYYAYTTRGELYRSWGDVPYPAEYHYNEYGDLTNLVTFRGGSSWTGSSWPSSPGAGDNTYWQYDEASGALRTKTDAQGQSVNYTYDTTTGKLLARSWGRTALVTNDTGSTAFVAVTVTNSYNGFGDLIAQEYNDGTPNVYFNNYNRAGQPREIVDGAGISELAYDHASRLVSATYAPSDYRPVAGQSVWINSPSSLLK